MVAGHEQVEKMILETINGYVLKGRRAFESNRNDMAQFPTAFVNVVGRS
jgi:hypothetical protein